MINSLRGKVLSINDESITLEVSELRLEGLLLKVSHVSGLSLRGAFCFAYMQVSDAGISLFGFSDEREHMLFLELLQVKTVGGKLAVTLLQHLDADQILQAIVSGSSSMLTVPGLECKRAERICFELKNKI